MPRKEPRMKRKVRLNVPKARSNHKRHSKSSLQASHLGSNLRRIGQNLRNIRRMPRRIRQPRQRRLIRQLIRRLRREPLVQDYMHEQKELTKQTALKALKEAEKRVERM